ncbi:MAG: methanogenesis marker 3 protein, partial [Methanosarcinales archaeon]|nr:methanogenesis marker 3 protein [Methanosarcinales archaeon]
YDDVAPSSLDFFRHVTGLLTRPVGPLSAYMAYENTLLLKALKEAPHKELMPENTPKEVAKAGEIGLTNQAAKRTETLGVKFVDDKRYGPSGEKFGSTNIIGHVIDMNKLIHIKEGDKIYLMEVKE